MAQLCEYDSKPSSIIKTGTSSSTDRGNNISRKALLNENATVFVDWSVY
jgi:hypothetical protein